MKKPWSLITDELLYNLSEEAKSFPRKRKNYNFHSDFADPINRMLNAFEPGTYCRPHKHEAPDKREVFIALKGRVAILFFNNDGVIIGCEIVAPLSDTIAVEIPAGVWHSAISLESGSVVYELKDGPYFPPTDKDFAPWSPDEGDDGCEAYLEELIQKADLSDAIR